MGLRGSRVSHVPARSESAGICTGCGRYVRRWFIGGFLTGRRYENFGLGCCMNFRGHYSSAINFFGEANAIFQFNSHTIHFVS